MKILIIGGTGFIGPFVAKKLLELGHEVTVFHRGSSLVELPAEIHHIYGDRRHLIDLKKELQDYGPTVVLDMISFFEADAKMVQQVLSSIADRFVVISSQDVYLAYGRLTGFEPGPILPGPVTEKSPLRQKLFPYRGQIQTMHDYDKILVEKVVLSNQGFPGTVLRLPMVYGPGDKQHRLFSYLKRMDDGRPAIMLEEKFSQWCWTSGYVENVAAAIVLAVVDERACNNIYNVGQDNTLSMGEWVRKIGTIAGWNGKIITQPSERLPEHLSMDINAAQHLVADTTKIRQELGYTETISLEQGLRRTINWERSSPPANLDPKLFNYEAEDNLLAELGV
ncbi:NAD-dependent epimerase/dehydratase family protein [candidate division CSSED10-310 bacterium]|uniref:NAD-dependent epimerase/dehydratase family protein n=1 Tax=candidate division CSSED10-310 bacterium TaxID=2855610 RepID=A0ABV6YVX9_UNCC1